MQGLTAKKLSSAHIELFMAVLVQNESVFVHFHSTLQPAHFREEYQQLFFRVLLEHYAENKQLPSHSELHAQLKSVFEEEPDIIDDDETTKLEIFLDYAFDPETFKTDPPDSKKMEQYAFRVGPKLMLEKLRSDAAIKLTDTQDLTTDSLSAFFHNSAAQADLLTKQGYSNEPTLTFDGGWDKRDPEYIYTTGFNFFDKYMAGGYKTGEIYGLMAPYGTCKTTLAVMLWCKAAEQCYIEATDPEFDEKSGRKGLTFLVTYEAPLTHEIRHRALMFFAGISRSRLDNMGSSGLDSLNADSDDPLPYEKKKFAKAISHGVFKAERHRVEEKIPILNEHTVCLDFTGSDPRWPNAGSKGVSEIVSRIELEIRNRGGEEKCYVKSVIIDYLGLLVSRDVTIAVGNSNNDEAKVLANHVSVIKHAVSVRFKCHTWLLHQLSGSANSMLNPTRKMWHTDSKGSKSFAENLDYSFVIGQLNLDNLGQIHCTKQRRSKRVPPSIIQVEGEFNTVFEPDNFHIDGKGQIVDKATAESTGFDAVQTFLGSDSTLQSTDNDDYVEHIESEDAND